MSAPKTVLITGCSTGFGFLTSRTLVEKGYTVFATMRELLGRNAPHADELRAFAEGKSGSLHVLELDVTSDSSVDAAVKQVADAGEPIDVLVNNAGFGFGGVMEAAPVADLKRVFEVNLFGVQRMNRAVLPAMRARGSGLLVHVSSIMGRVVLPHGGAYAATKYALEGLVETYRYELSTSGVDVTIVEPGGFGTEFHTKVGPPPDAAREAEYGDLSERLQGIWDAARESLKGEDAPDPQDVADAIVGLIEMPPGQRPLRTVVDPMFGGEAPSAINAMTDQIQAQLLEFLGAGDLASGNTSQ